MNITHKVKLSLKLARWHYTPVIIVPVILGALLAWYQGRAMRWMDFVLCLVGAWFAHLGANAANDVFDDISGVDRIAHDIVPENRGSTVCGSEVLTKGLLTRREGFFATAAFFSLALACGIPLMIRSGWPIIVIAAVGFFLATFYCARPIAFGYWGRGLGELGILIAFGPLPVLGAYLVQGGTVLWTAALASIPAGLFTVSVLYNHHFTHAVADERAGKNSPVVALGEEKARKLSPWILAAAYVALIINVVLGIFPAAALAGLVTAPFIFRSYCKLNIPSTCAESVAFLFNVVRTNIVTGVLIICAILITRFI